MRTVDPAVAAPFDAQACGRALLGPVPAACCASNAVWRMFASVNWPLMCRPITDVWYSPSCARTACMRRLWSSWLSRMSSAWSCASARTARASSWLMACAPTSNPPRFHNASAPSTLRVESVMGAANAVRGVATARGGRGGGGSGRASTRPQRSARPTVPSRTPGLQLGADFLYTSEARVPLLDIACGPELFRCGVRRQVHRPTPR